VVGGEKGKKGLWGMILGWCGARGGKGGGVGLGFGVPGSGECRAPGREKLTTYAAITRTKCMKTWTGGDRG